MTMQLVHILLYCVTVYGMQNGAIHKYYTIDDHAVDLEYTYAVRFFKHETQCVFNCLVDTRCNSVGYHPDTGKCALFEQFPTANITVWKNFLNQSDGWRSISKLVDTGEDRLCMDTGYPKGETCYKFLLGNFVNIHAQTLCSDHGGKLAEILTSYENDMIKRVLRKVFYKDNRSWWFGLTDQAVEGQWVWLSSGHAPDFTNWDDGEPNDGIVSNCSMLASYEGFRWVDTRCEQKKPTFCEL